MKRLLQIWFLLLLNPLCTLAEDSKIRHLEGTAITGNNEQPKVLSIVPWKSPEQPEDLFTPVSSLVDSLLEPVDREIFLRELRYYDDLRTREGGTKYVR